MAPLLRLTALAVSAALAIATVALALANGKSVSLLLFGLSWQTPLTLLILLAMAAGALVPLGIFSLRLGRAENEKRQLKWDKEDAKLRAEVVSDREKQLQAKITTLEQALKSALNKK